MTNSIRWSVVLVVVAGAGCEALGLRGAEYRPRIDPADFQATVDNPYYPLVPGTTLRFVEKAEGETLENEITVTDDTKVVMGVPCVVVHDVVRQNGMLKEDTYDWLAQHRDGTVWYFGEDTKEISAGGRVSTKGSWQAGVNGAQPGILMPGHPAPGDPYRQEYGRGEAEDMGQIVATSETVSVPAGTFTNCVKTQEWSLLEPGTENKWYCKGVGVVKEVSTGGDVATLISITQPPARKR